MAKKKKGFIKKFIGEFKTFISRGSVIDLAVGVVVGGAFTAIVNSLVDNILMPVVGAILGGINFTSLGFHLPYGKHPYIDIGSFLSAVITFLITAFCLFIIIKAVNTIQNLKKKEEATEEEEKEEEIAADIALLTEIRDLLKAQNEKE